MKKAILSLSVVLLSLLANVASAQITSTRYSVQYNKTLCRYEVYLHIVSGTTQLPVNSLLQSASTNQITLVVPAGSTFGTINSVNPKLGTRSAVNNTWTQTGTAAWGNTVASTQANGTLPTATDGPTLVGKDVYAFVVSPSSAYYDRVGPNDSLLLFYTSITVPSTVTTCDKGVRLWNNNVIKGVAQDGATTGTGCGGTITAHDPCSGVFPGGEQFNNGIGIGSATQLYEGNYIRDTRQAPPIVNNVGLTCNTTQSTLTALAAGACASTISSYSYVNGSNTVVSTTSSLTVSNSSVNNPYTLTITATNGCTTQVQRNISTTGCFILPVKLMAFNAIADKCNAQLNWEIAASDKDFERFDIQYSRDGNQFATVSQVARNAYNEKYSYSYSQTSGRGYYRLAIVDLKGTVTYSDTRNVITSCDDNVITISPNPTAAASTVKGLEAGDHLKVTDMLGNVLANYVSGGNQATIELTALPAGIYSVMVSRNGEIVKAAKITKL